MSTEQYDRLYSGNSAGQPTSSASSQIKVEFQDITEIESPYGDVAVTRPTAERDKAKPTNDRYSSVGLIVRRRRQVDKRVKFVHLEVWSPIIQKALTILCGDSYWLSTSVTPQVIERPYVVLFHNRKKIREYAESAERTAEERNHMRLLTEFMTREHGRVEAKYDSLAAGKQISYDMLWTFYCPDEEILVHNDQYTECGVLWRLQYFDEGWQIGTRGWDYNGSHFGPVDRTVVIKPFDGLCDITTLEACPSRFYGSQADSLRKKLVERGRKWKSLLHVAHRSYSGLAWKNAPRIPGQPPTAETLIPMHVSGRIILDYNTHYQDNPEHQTTFSTNLAKITQRTSEALGDETQDAPTGQDEADKPEPDVADRFMIRRNDKTYRMSDEQAIVCPARIRGFSLADKTFAFFLVDKVTDIQWREDALEKLEIKQDFKDTINDLVKQHDRNSGGLKAEFKDIIEGKGLGLVFLLAGAPGLGKTLTAEVVAEHNRKPLYAITSGEIDLDGYGVDQGIRKIFDRAKAWDAHLLLDEADVFLAERVRNDISRNNLVTVFLRQIEYYQGVIFLTTNRLTAFDSAFESRIQLKLFYNALTIEQRESIWKSLIPQSSMATADDQVYNRLAKKYEINGREIKNMIKVAMAIATRGNGGLEEKHFEKVAQMNAEWAKHAKEIGEV